MDVSVCKELCGFDGAVRAVSGADGDSCSKRIQEVHSILTDSGADASIFPSSLFVKGRQVSGPLGKLCDVQGVEIPLTALQDMEIRLQDTAGRTMLLREKVALSDRVTEPILCHGHL